MKRRSRKKRNLLMLIVALLAIGGFLLTPQITNMIILNQNNCDYKGKGIRPLYFDCKFQNAMFSQLPEMPADFYTVRTAFVYKFVRFTDRVLNESYWKQPEWFPTFASEGGALQAIKAFRENESSRITIWCAGIYPADFYAKTAAGRSITVYTWVRNSPHQQKYEGIKLTPVYPECDSFEEIGFDLGNNNVCQDLNYVKENVKIKIEPDLFLLTPSYPVYTPDSTSMIKVDISIDSDMKPGRYIVGFDSNLPPEEFNEFYYDQYGFQYTGSQREFHCAPGPQYRLFIDVEAPLA